MQESLRHFVNTGDFNGDRKDDILWRHDDGTANMWLMNGAQRLASKSLGNMADAWHVAGTGDFNGDGRADIPWQNDNGQALVWLMNGVNRIGTGALGPAPGPGWHEIG